MKTIEVPYVNQQENSIRNDCGPACACMVILAYTGEQVAIEDYYKELNIATGSPQSVDDLIRFMGRHNVFVDDIRNCTISNLRYWIDNGQPFIALVTYKPLSSSGITYYPGTFNHFVVVVGYDQDIPCVVIHDPYWPDGRGSYLVVPTEVFAEAWSMVDSPLIALVPRQKLGDDPMAEGNYKVTASYLYIRSCPSTGCGIVGGLHRDDVVQVGQISGGWGNIGENKWVSMQYLAPMEQPPAGEGCKIVVKVTGNTITIIPPEGSTIEVDNG